MGDCLLEKTALNDDEESGKVLLMLAKVQFELQRLVDGSRSYIFWTIAIPSESFLNELRIVEVTAPFRAMVMAAPLEDACDVAYRYLVCDFVVM
ncbi:hypothetical protein CDL12_25129 [Handroanthus impetiginosus]|uniref:Uncharacterized protein n=1 Tax=Handroanthus impetiginosus TaxID=429701 RepID=A0A2G9GAP1_9LAMI|nr:hypothetical protein CDL12_25129 [Handroanthus impetiginosus]